MVGKDGLVRVRPLVCGASTAAEGNPIVPSVVSPVASHPRAVSPPRVEIASQIVIGSDGSPIVYVTYAVDLSNLTPNRVNKVSHNLNKNLVSVTDDLFRQPPVPCVKHV